MVDNNGEEMMVYKDGLRNIGALYEAAGKTYQGADLHKNIDFNLGMEKKINKQEK